MTANKATPEELIERMREADGVTLGNIDECEIRHCPGWTFKKIQEARALIREAADLIESQRNAVIEELVKRQAEDAGLWFNAKYATEAYLQDALRQLHKAVEDLKNDSAVPVERQCES